MWGKGTQSDLDPGSERSHGDRPEVPGRLLELRMWSVSRGGAGAGSRAGAVRWGEGARGSVGSMTWPVEHQGLEAWASGKVFKLWVGHKQRKCPPALQVFLRCAHHPGQDLALRCLLGVHPHACGHTRLQGCGPIHLNVTDDKTSSTDCHMGMDTGTMSFCSSSPETPAHGRHSVKP